ncbi:PREDICTED: uncharacterized protein LOC101291641 [Fragaria vesca subsp. vesca]|uniref:uncharacterized protein LOC101291641 n=1 Tax=Fragaria vesca subsp. vesca TaxID=101020 RepID=UPI0002C2DE1C|nr:PREDICTED: uncharacterized protein LOC101291641 [Fragaria vesca subsp. vesca]
MAAATAAPKLLLLLRYFSSSGPPNTLMGSSKVAVHIPYSCFSSTRAKRSLPIRARGRDQQEEDDDSNTTGFNSPQNDLEYLGKVLAGSIVGGAVIKYGSIVFPEITRPNIILALVMIFTPVVVATLLLIKQSRANG